MFRFESKAQATRVSVELYENKTMTWKVAQVCIHTQMCWAF